MSVLLALLCFVTSASAAVNGDSNRIPFVADDFDYSEATLSSYSYTYVDESTGATVTVPLTTPATSTAAIKALLREVYTNREIPGRKWIYGSDEVDYTISYSRNPKAIEDFGIAPGDYTPIHDGLTCLLVEGVDEVDDYVGGIEKIKSVTLLTSRMAIDAGNSIPGSPTVNPGYLFNIKKPLYKFYFMTKGKPRRLDHEIRPFYNLFEEFSPNDGNKETNSINAYGDLMEGSSFCVSHDCSGVVTNKGHITKVQSRDGVSAVSINLSLFIPFYRNYDDSNRTNYSELYTWYDPKFEPFLYYYAIKLSASAQPALDTDEYYDVNLEWNTNFRRFFHTDHNGEFWVYKVIDGIQQVDPIMGFTFTPDGDVTAFDNTTGRVTSHSPDCVRVTYREPVTASSRFIYYVVGGRPETMNCDLTFSNTDRVQLPGRDENQAFVVNINGSGLSDFNMVKGWNAYTNTIDIYNRADEFAFTSDMLRVDGEFSIQRESENDPVQTVGYLSVDTFVETPVKETYTCSLLDSDRVPVTDDLGEAVSITLIAHKTGPDAGIVKGEESVASADIPDIKLFDFVDRFDEKILPDNTHPSYYTYRVSYSAPATADDSAVHKGSNEETINIYKSTLQIVPVTYSLDEIALDQTTPYLDPSGYEARVEVTNMPEVMQFRLRGKGFTEEINDQGNVFAIVENNAGEFNVLMPSESGLYTPVGESLKLDAGESGVVTIPMTVEQWQQSDYLVVEACTESPIATFDASTEVAERHYETFGSPSVSPDYLPQLIIGDPKPKYNLANPGWWINRMEMYTDIPDNGLVGSDIVSQVYTYALWRHTAPKGTDDFTTTLLHNGSNAKPFTGTDYVFAVHEQAPSDRFGHISLNTRDGIYDPDQQLDVYYQGRVYIEVEEAVPYSMADYSPRYMVAEDFRKAQYSGSTTGVDDVVVAPEAEGPAEYFTIQGVRVAEPQPGNIYIVRRGTSVTKQHF